MLIRSHNRFFRALLVAFIAGLVMAPVAVAQTSSLGARKRQSSEFEPQPQAQSAREAPSRPRNLVYERYAWTAEKPTLPKKYRPGDLITIIIREQRKWEADSELESGREFDIQSQINAFPKLTDGGLGSAAFSRGRPNVDFRYDRELKTEGDGKREDRLTTRLTAKIIDVKPNGLLVLEGRAKVTHDEEISEITLIGTCRKEDVSADNTVLSTQIADKEVKVMNKGALRASSSRGWVTKILDLLRPF